MSEEKGKTNLKFGLNLAAGVGLGVVIGALYPSCPLTLQEAFIASLIPALPAQMRSYNTVPERVATGFAFCGGSLTGQALYALYRMYT